MKANEQLFYLDHSLQDNFSDALDDRTEGNLMVVSDKMTTEWHAVVVGEMLMKKRGDMTSATETEEWSSKH